MSASSCESMPLQPQKLRMRRRLEVCISPSGNSSFLSLGRGSLVVLPVLVASSSLFWPNDTIQATTPFILQDWAGRVIQYVSQLLLDGGIIRTHIDISNDTHNLIMGATGVLCLALLWWKVSSHHATQTTKLAVVTLYPALGVQLSTEQQTLTLEKQDIPSINNNATRTIMGTPIFLPREFIVDCLVYEVILSHKVVTVVAFSILNLPPGTGDNDDTPQQQLVPAFPGTEMTYQECLYMRRQIVQTLGDGLGGSA